MVTGAGAGYGLVEKRHCKGSQENFGGGSVSVYYLDSSDSFIVQDINYSLKISMLYTYVVY